ncbi:hypothetical protein [Rhodococcus sp. 27YEA15]|uniref:hypothetical protein n=1 Tax=Rhodococcus sp. 27YEA15 TaxID=3156259 RepID=UPI003C7D8396
MASRARIGGRRADLSTINKGMDPHISVVDAQFAPLGASPSISPNPNALARTLGREPTTFEEFATENASEFAQC